MFDVNKPIWQREGSVLPNSVSVSLDRAMELAGAAFHVELCRIFVGGPVENDDDPRTLREAPGYVATCRTDTGALLGIVGDRYTPIQNRDVFGILEPLLESGKATLETAGVLRDGRDVWVQARFNLRDPEVQEVFGDEIVPFALLSNNHSGDRGVTLQETPIRLACGNTLGAARRQATGDRIFRVRHTVNVRSRAAEAADALWNLLLQRCREVARQYELLRRSRLREEDFRELVLDPLASIRKEWLAPEATPGQRKALRLARERRTRLRHLWESGGGHIGDGSGWEAYNAAVEALDHDERLWPAKENNRLASLFDGRLAVLKQTVVDRLVDHALSES